MSVQSRAYKEILEECTNDLNEDLFNVINTGPIYLMEGKKACLRCCRPLRNLKVAITVFKFIFSLLAVSCLSKVSSYGVEPATIGSIIVLSINLLKYVFLFIFTCFGIYKRCSAKCCKTFINGFLEISCVCCCLNAFSNMIIYLVYYSVIIIISIVLNSLSAKKIESMNINDVTITIGILFMFLVFFLHILSLIVEIVRLIFYFTGRRKFGEENTLTIEENKQLLFEKFEKIEKSIFENLN